MKTIKIQNVKIKEFTISEKDGDFTISLVYSLLDLVDKEWDTKRTTIRSKQLTNIEKQNISKVLVAIINKIKILEELD